MGRLGFLIAPNTPDPVPFVMINIALNNILKRPIDISMGEISEGFPDIIWRKALSAILTYLTPGEALIAGGVEWEVY